ncbi:sialidase-4 [Ochotona curzoniae]|uniref:sialidase-4 n=1 Tax=Ochotona curzoniae TaxID=130825 RepID=UPI001B35163B|nr:sialidase-4 [Ochotona curzoniae]
MRPTPMPARKVLFQQERTGLTYRVPALLPVPPGPTLLAFAEQRLSPDDSHAHRLVLRRGTRAGSLVQWGPLCVLDTATLPGHRSMNPCPVRDASTGTIFLFFIAVRGRTPEALQIRTGKNAARLCCVVSRDAGLTWGGAWDLTKQAIGDAEQGWATFAVGPGHGVQLSSGRLLVPAYTYRVDGRECFGHICRTSPHAFAFFSDDHGHTWHCSSLVPNLRSGECQLAALGGGLLYCNARSPLGHRLQALSTDEGSTFLAGQLVPSLPETARGCQGSILGFPAPSPGRSAPDEPESPEDEETPGGDLSWLLYSHPTGHRARLHMGIRLSRSPPDPRSWTKPWVIYEGPSGYSDLACLGPVPRGTLGFACLFESGARASYEEVSFCEFSLHDVLDNVPPGHVDKAAGHCWPC